MANKIKQLRDEKGVTQQDLAVLLNIKVAGVSKIETGQVPLKDEYIIKLAGYFNVTTDYLLGISERNTVKGKDTTVSEKVDNTPTPYEKIELIVMEKVMGLELENAQLKSELALARAKLEVYERIATISDSKTTLGFGPPARKED